MRFSGGCTCCGGVSSRCCGTSFPAKLCAQVSGRTGDTYDLNQYYALTNTGTGDTYVGDAYLIRCGSFGTGYTATGAIFQASFGCNPPSTNVFTFAVGEQCPHGTAGFSAALPYPGFCTDGLPYTFSFTDGSGGTLVISDGTAGCGTVDAGCCPATMLGYTPVVQRYVFGGLNLTTTLGPFVQGGGWIAASESLPSDNSIFVLQCEGGTWTFGRCNVLTDAFTCYAVFATVDNGDGTRTLTFGDTAGTTYYKATIPVCPLGADPPRPVAAVAARGGGPGTELKALLASVGITPQGCGCNSVAGDMDRGGVAWCRANRAKLADHLKMQAAQRTWAEKAAAGTLAVVTGLAFRLDPADVFGSLIDEAIRRAER